MAGDIKVVMSGDGSDECSGYIYNYNTNEKITKKQKQD